MRNIFDQYNQPENKLTHALVSSLAQDPRLLRAFLKWATAKKFSGRDKLTVIEQTLPGQEELDETEAGKKGLPDACVFDDDGWILIIESKVASRLTASQLRRHYDTVVRRGYKNPKILAITASDQVPQNLAPYVISKTWREIYEWGYRQVNKCYWSRFFLRYFEILEAKMVKEEYLKAGTLTKFSGIPFCSGNPYSYCEAKRLLRLIVDEFKSNGKLMRDLGIDIEFSGRAAIKGVKGTQVWDFLRFREAKKEKSFTKYPHLTFAISYSMCELKLTLPHNIHKQLKARIFGLSFDDFCEVIGAVMIRSKKSIQMDPAIKPVITLLQRHYLSQSDSGIIDAALKFDLRTMQKEQKGKEKYQPEWIKTAFDVMNNKKSNIQIQIGFEIPLDKSKVIKTEKAIAVLEEAARALLPFLNVIFGRR